MGIKNVNGGPTRGGGAPKDTSMGKDLGRDATNVIKKLSVDEPECSPSASSMSNAKGKGSHGKQY